MDTLTIPQGRTLPVVGDLYRLLFEDGIAYFQGLQRRFGAITRFKLGPINAILVTDPDLVGKVLGRDVRTYKKGIHFDTTRLFLGNGLFVSEGKDWRKHRRMLNPKFTTKEVLNYAETVSIVTHDTVDQWVKRKGEPFHMDREMGHLAMNIILASMFGPGEIKDEAYGDAVRYCLDFVMARGRNPFALPLSVPLPSHKKFQAARKQLEDLLQESIVKIKARGDDRPSLINDLLTAKDEEDESYRMSDRQVIDELLTVFLAGHETTALAMSWTWYLLNENPKVKAKVAAEIERVTGGEPVTPAHIPELTYVAQVAQEVLRLYPPVGFYPRQSLVDQKLGPYEVKAGEHIMLAPYVTHRLPEYWERPDEFDPDRFEKSRADAQHPFAFFPFGKGRRICLGQHFAMMEMVLAISVVMQRVDLELVTENVKPKFVATLRPSELRMKATPKA